ncbi:GNAT family N-acetyltransferase [Streptococcus rifensis]
MWTVKDFDELTTRELHAIYELRVAVFVVEQACAYQEVDQSDLTCLHGMNWRDGALASYFRLIEAEDGVHLGRVIVSPKFRKQGLGRGLLEKALDVTRRLYPGLPLHAQAQAHLQDFYASFGFEPVGDVYLEDGIPHIDMTLRL